MVLKKLDCEKAVIVVSITAGICFADEEIQEFFQENRSRATDQIADIFKLFGDERYTLPPLGLLYLFGDDKAKKTALLGFKSFLITGIFTQVIKYSIQRERPDSGNPSFPSGHTSSAFTIAAIGAEEYGCSIIWYCAATLCGLAIINNNRHFASDVFFGGCLEYFTAKVICSLKENLILIPNGMGLRF